MEIKGRRVEQSKTISKTLIVFVNHTVRHQHLALMVRCLKVSTINRMSIQQPVLAKTVSDITHMPWQADKFQWTPQVMHTQPFSVVQMLP